jgi:uncharacterized protein YuzE
MYDMEEEENSDIDLIYATLQEAGVENIDTDDELNIELAEHDGIPPVRVSTKKKRLIKKRK